MTITAKEDSPDFKGELAWLQKPEIVCRGAQITGIYAKNKYLKKRLFYLQTAYTSSVYAKHNCHCR